jgi:farnesyl-diphosphate farnesyltransferase
MSQQDAYGKIPTFKPSIWEQLYHFDEIFYALYLKFTTWWSQKTFDSAAATWCNEMLGKVSRSFTLVIRQLPDQLYDPIMIFYLVLRGLDTVEDDMEFMKDNLDGKKAILSNFHTWLETGDKPFDGDPGEGDEKDLIENFGRVVNIYRKLDDKYKQTITDITHKMGKGMGDFQDRDMRNGTETIEEYNLYCHYVAGLVGHGLSDLVVQGGFEEKTVSEDRSTANLMGLMLQKTNITRDYLEDMVEGRSFWPKEIWGKHVPEGKQLDWFGKNPSDINSINCLDAMIFDAMKCVPACLTYLSRLKTPQVFRFCAIPQVMAMATLAECYHNPKVFQGVVKTRKGLSAKIFCHCNDINDVYYWFSLFIDQMLKRRFKNELKEISRNLDSFFVE